MTGPAGPRMLALRDPGETVSSLAAACMALEFVTQPETFPVFLAFMREQREPGTPENPDVAAPLAFQQALEYLDTMFELLGGRDD